MWSISHHTHADGGMSIEWCVGLCSGQATGQGLNRNGFWAGLHLLLITWINTVKMKLIDFRYQGLSHKTWKMGYLEENVFLTAVVHHFPFCSFVPFSVCWWYLSTASLVRFSNDWGGQWPCSVPLDGSFPTHKSQVLWLTPAVCNRFCESTFRFTVAFDRR